MRIPLSLGGKPEGATADAGDEGALDIDFSGALRLALNCHLNNQLLKPTESQSEIRNKVLEAPGISKRWRWLLTATFCAGVLPQSA